MFNTVNPKVHTISIDTQSQLLNYNQDLFLLSIILGDLPQLLFMQIMFRAIFSMQTLQIVVGGIKGLNEILHNFWQMFLVPSKYICCYLFRIFCHFLIIFISQHTLVIFWSTHCHSSCKFPVNFSSSCLLLVNFLSFFLPFWCFVVILSIFVIYLL